MGLFKHTDTYNYYIDYIKPKINVKKLKRIVSKHKIVDFFVQNARTIGIVYVVGAVVVFLAMTAFYIWVDRASKKEQELYYDEYYYPDDKFAERMSVVVWFILSLGCAILSMNSSVLSGFDNVDK